MLNYRALHDVLCMYVTFSDNQAHVNISFSESVMGIDSIHSFPRSQGELQIAFVIHAVSIRFYFQIQNQRSIYFLSLDVWPLDLILFLLLAPPVERTQTAIVRYKWKHKKGNHIE